MTGRRRAAPAAARRAQRGLVLITVVVIGSVVTALFAGIVAYLANAEGNAISASLLKVRAHWAMVGHANYLRARVPRVGSNLEAAGHYAGTAPTQDDTLPEIDNFQSTTLVAPAGYLLGSAAGARVAWNATASAIGACPGITSLDPIDASNVVTDAGQDYSTLSPDAMAQCILEELSTTGLAGAIPGANDFAHGRCWHFQEYSFVIGARTGATARPNDAATTAALPTLELVHTAQGGLTASFRLERVSTGLVAGEAGFVQPCGSDSPAPPFVENANLQNLAPDLHVAVGYKIDGGNRASIFTDYWRQAP